jgi:uncharacterized protein (UPF0297 family)
MSEIMDEIRRIDGLVNGALRFGQIVGNVFHGDPYYVSDAELLSRLIDYRKALEATR